VGNGPNEPIGIDSYSRLPGHAEYLESIPSMGPYTRIRHFRWTNTYEGLNGERILTIDRWINGRDGLIKETLKETGETIGTLTRDEAALKPSILKLGAPFDGGLSLHLKRLEGGNYVPVDTSEYSYRIGYGSESSTTYFAALATGQYQVTRSIAIAAGDPTPLTFDVGWEVNPGIKANALFTSGQSAFTFAPKHDAENAEYQILVADYNKQSIWSSTWSGVRSIAWNGMRGDSTDEPTTPYAGAGLHYYQIKFREAGSTFGGSGYYGSTGWIPFYLSEPLSVN
jgi:hypothetical protein